MCVSHCDLVEALASDSEEHKPFFLVEKESRGKNKKSGAFPKLESIQIYVCPSLSTILRSTIIVGGFQSLESLDVIGCASLKQVFQVEDRDEEKTRVCPGCLHLSSSDCCKLIMI